MERVGEDKRGFKTTPAFAKMPDKAKRDEWSEGGVTTLLDAYEDKWIIRNRAKLKGSDWEEIAQEVSSRDNGKKSVKAPNQCKNKIEAMKKRYRTESTTSNHTWHFFSRMDRLLKGKDVVSNGVGERQTVTGAETKTGLQALRTLVDDLEKEDNNNNNNVVNDVTEGNTLHVKEAHNGKMIENNGKEIIRDNDQDDGSSKGHENSEFSTPYNPEENVSERFVSTTIKRRRSDRSDIAESIRMLARSMLKIEQSRSEMYRDTERIRADAEIKRAEMDLKRTEIISKTQLQIAKLLVKGNDNDTSGSSSLVAQRIAEEKSCKYLLPVFLMLSLFLVIVSVSSYGLSSKNDLFVSSLAVDRKDERFRLKYVVKNRIFSV